MMTGLYIVGVVSVLCGSVWLLQGINILPGSFMTGQIEWAIIGGIAIVIGTSLILFRRNRK